MTESGILPEIKRFIAFLVSFMLLEETILSIFGFIFRIGSTSERNEFLENIASHQDFCRQLLNKIEVIQTTKHMLGITYKISSTTRRFKFEEYVYKCIELVDSLVYDFDFYRYLFLYWMNRLKIQTSVSSSFSIQALFSLTYRTSPVSLNRDNGYVE